MARRTHDERESGSSRDRREHGGASPYLDDDALAARTERERVEAGLDAFDPADVPPATDAPPTDDVTDTDAFREERAEIVRQQNAGELGPITEERPFPPTRYDRS